jgi:hypothetical protein
VEITGPEVIGAPFIWRATTIDGEGGTNGRISGDAGASVAVTWCAVRSARGARRGLAVLEQVGELVAAGRGQLVVITGEAGLEDPAAARVLDPPGELIVHGSSLVLVLVEVVDLGRHERSTRQCLATSGSVDYLQGVLAFRQRLG